MKKIKINLDEPEFEFDIIEKDSKSVHKNKYKKILQEYPTYIDSLTKNKSAIDRQKKKIYYKDQKQNKW